MVYCIPNGAESSKIVNRSQFTDRIVLVDRGRETTIKDKISRITKGMMESGEGDTRLQTFCIHVVILSYSLCMIYVYTVCTYVRMLGGGGASAIIIADDGQCRSDFSFCGNRVG